MNLILEHSDIQAIFTTGTKAAQLYKKYCYPQTGIQAISLPSTSPANCRMSYEELYDAYAVIKNLSLIHISLLPAQAEEAPSPLRQDQS